MKSAAAVSRQLQSQRKKHKTAKKIQKVSTSSHHHRPPHHHPPPPQHQHVTTINAGSPSSTMPGNGHGQHLPRPRMQGPFRDTMGLHPRPRKKGFTMLALKGKFTVKCVWAACKAMSIGFVFIAIGASMLIVGFYADELSVKGTEVINGTSVIARDKSKHYHLSNMFFVGPIVLSIGGFVIIAACVMTFESRDTGAKIVPIKHKKKKAESCGNNRIAEESDHSVSIETIDSPATIDFSKAFANLNRAALTSAFIQFSGTFPKTLENTSRVGTRPSCDPFDSRKSVIRKSPSEPVLGRTCAICSSRDPDQKSSQCTNCHLECDRQPCDKCNKMIFLRKSFSIDNHNMDINDIKNNDKNMTVSSSSVTSVRSLLPYNYHNNITGANCKYYKRKSYVPNEEFPLLGGIVPMAEQEDDEDDEESLKKFKLSRSGSGSVDSVPMDVLLADCSVTVKVTVEPYGDYLIQNNVANKIRSGCIRPKSIGDKRRINYSNGETVPRKCSPGGESIDFSDDNTESTTGYCEQWGSRKTRKQPMIDNKMKRYSVIRQSSGVNSKLTRHK